MNKIMNILNHLSKFSNQHEGSKLHSCQNYADDTVFGFQA